jgi:putative membrane-bound dehydrogenase-like protein
MKRLLSCFALLIPSLLHAQGYTPEEAVKRMKVPEGFAVKCVAHEPMIRQPLSVSFDERGRMWVLQYLQYPNPAGLRPLKQDQYLRTIWDRIPEPPPKGPKGLDKITICYDPDDNGSYRKSKDFVDGLNLATGFCIGNGGVYVVQPPYLLFYPDKNRDDVPDGDPEVCISGFGMEDTHSYANSLQWGPDGWLYGAHGSTVTAKITNPAKPKDPPLEFQQGIWRYHPKSKQFELFSEGGGNTYGLDFDKHGQAIAGTNWGGKAMLHQMQGAYYVKGFSKHGPLHNPHAYGYFDHVPYEGFVGGHVTCGGVVYQADAYPKEYHDQYIAGNLLSNACYWHKMTPKGSSFTAKHGGDFLIANDPWFRPVDCFQGPDGSIYIADWYDKRAAHLDPIDNWDKTNGRIYKVEYKGTKQPGEFDLAKKSSGELVELLKHPNKWWRNEARRLLAEKGADKDVIAKLRTWATDEKGVLALEALWAVNAINAIDDPLVSKLVKHSDEQVRAWCIRLVGDTQPDSSSASGWQLLAEAHGLAEIEKNPIVLVQLAATAKYLRDKNGMLLVDRLMWREDLPDDSALPLMIWWAVESKTELLRDKMMMNYAGCSSGQSYRLFVLERVARRWAATNNEYVSLLLPTNAFNDDTRAAPDVVRAVLNGIDQGMIPSTTDRLRKSLIDKLKQLSATNRTDPIATRLLIRLGDEPTYQTILKQSNDSKAPDADRLKKLELLAEIRKPDALPLFLDLYQNGKSEALRLAALNAMQGYADPKVNETALTLFPKLTGKLRQATQAMLLSRKETALALLQLLDKGTLKTTDLTVDQVRPVLAFDDQAINKLVVKHYGKIGAATAGEKQARISWLRIELGRGTGNVANGKALFTKHCATCHTMFGEGGKIGPDLTTADRKNRDYLLLHIVDPSLYVRPEFISYNVTTLDGRKLTGLVSAAESNEGTVTLVNVIDNKPVKTAVAKKDIDDMLPSAISMMPDKLLDTLEYQDVRDLFAFMQSQAPGAKKDAPGAKPKGDGRKLKVLLISGSLEYKSDESLAEFQKYLEANYPVECSRAFRKTDDDLPGLEALETCDVAVFFTRRLTIKGEQLDRVKKYATSGKPIVAIRTASHGFQNWLEMDKEVLGGNYKGHFGAGPKCEVKVVEAAKEHPVLKNVKPYSSTGSLYKNPDLGKDVTVLMAGSIPNQTEPITWVRENKGGRVVYTSLGHPDDFKNDTFLRLLVNAMYWAAKKELPAN